MLPVRYLVRQSRLPDVRNDWPTNLFLISEVNKGDRNHSYRTVPNRTKMAKKTSSGKGGIKGFFSRATHSFYSGGIFARDTSLWLSEKLLTLGFVIATTSLVTLMPLIFEIAREGQVCIWIILLSYLNWKACWRLPHCESVNALLMNWHLSLLEHCIFSDCCGKSYFNFFCDKLLKWKMIENEKSIASDLRSQGYSDKQLASMGFSEAAANRAPSVATQKI